MGKTITINQNSLLAIKESMVGINDVSHNNVCVNEAAPEVDEFELGQESDNPPVGGNFCHVEEDKLVTESKNSNRAHRQTRQIIARTLGTDENDPSVIKAEREFEAKMFGEGKRVDWMIVLEPLAYDWYLQCENMNVVQGYLDYIYLKGTESTPPSAYIADIKQFVDFNELKQFLDQQKKADDAASMEAQANMEVNLNQNYEVRGPLSFEEASEIGKYSNPNGQICYTQDEDIWDSDNYGNYDINKCYVLLRNDWNNIEPNHDGSETNNGLPSPLNQYNGYDSYGLSMIFVWIGRFGNLIVSNTRWNHDAEYAPGHSVDHALTELDIARLMGEPFEQVFGVKKINIDDYVQKGLDSHMDIQDIFDEVYDEYCGLRCVKIGSKYNYVASENSTLYGFDYKYLYLLWDKPYDEWFEDANDFNTKTNLGTVEVNGKTYFIDKYAKLYDVTETTKRWLADGKLDMFLDVWGDGAIVKVTYDYSKYNFVNTNTKKLLWDKPYDEWFNHSRNFRFNDRYVLVKLNDDLYFFDVNGNLSDITETVKKRLKVENPIYIFDHVEGYGETSYDIHKVKLLNSYNFINIKTYELVWDKPFDKWFNEALDFYDRDKVSVRYNNGPWLLLDKSGKLYDNSGNSIEENKMASKNKSSINEDYLRNRLSSIDLSEVGRVNYSFDFDEAEYNEWLAENGLQDSEETRYEFYKGQWEYEVEYLDNDTLHYMEGDSGLSYDDLEDLFGENMAETIVRTCMRYGSGYFETDDLYADEQIDINNPQELNAFATKLLRHGEYFKGCRGFILTNGVVIYTDMEHNEVLRIPGINSKFQFIELGNIRILDHAVDIGAEPTWEQEKVLRQVIASYDGEEFYLDIYSDGGEIGAQYPNADYQYIMGEIDRFYSEGIRPQGGGFYESKDGKKTVDENVDLEVDASEIDLSSFKKRSELAPIWEDGDTLDSRVRLRLLDIADDFWEFVNLTWVKPSGIILTGSICNFNWSKYSDIDLHLIVDFDEIDEKTEFVQDYLDSKKNEWNNEHNGLTILGFPVELYVQNLGDMPKSGGVYDLEENAWIKKPNASDIKPIGLDKFSIKDKAAEIMTIIDDMYNALSSEDDMHRIEEIGEDAHYLWKKVKDMRQTSLEKNGESGAGNIIYKILRRMDYLDKLWKLSTLTYDKTNSIEEGKKIYISEDKLALLTESQETNKIDSINHDDIFELAKKHFGVTRDIRECGYVLPDGSMLDFSGRHTLNAGTDSSHLRGRRGVDHREIYEIGWDETGNVKNFDLTMEDFIRAGAVRVHVSSKYCSVNLYQKPTDSQIQVLMNIIRYAKGCVDVEIGDGNESLSYAEYDGVKAKKPISDILRYFDEGINLVTESKEILNEYLEKQYNLPLYKYFKWAETASDKEKVENVFYNCPNFIEYYLEGVSGNYDILNEFCEKIRQNANIINDKNFINQLVNVIDELGLNENALEYLETSIDPEEQPTWMIMRLVEIIKNRWCIHFTNNANDAYNIAKNGFIKGTTNINFLAYTIGQEKNSPGYDFAFLLDDNELNFNSFGNGAVIFKTNGVLAYHEEDASCQVIFWGPSVKEIIPIEKDQNSENWLIKGLNGKIFKSGTPSELAIWVDNNFEQYRKQIVTNSQAQLYYNEEIKKYLTLLKEETVADGSSTSNPYKKRWKAEREALKNFVSNYGKLMQSKEDDKGGKLYKVFYDKTMSDLIGYNYCVAVQYDEINNKPKSTVYVRALDKFTPFIRRNLQFDTRGMDNKIETNF